MRILYLQSSTTNRADLNHSRNVTLDVCELNVAHLVKTELFGEILLSECTRNKALIDSYDIVSWVPGLGGDLESCLVLHP